MKKIIFLSLLFLFASALQAQQNNIQVGLELDALPYLTGGYFVGGWIGQNHWRARALHANVHKPDWTTTQGFSNHRVNAYALLLDFFPKQEWRSWWIGAGPVYWRSHIQSDEKKQTVFFQNYLLNGSMGYNLKLGKKVYISPWAGLSMRIAGDRDVPVDQSSYTLPLFNPEASLKLGVYF